MTTPAQTQIARLIGANIAAERSVQGIQQGALAERLGIAQGSLSKLENGHGIPGPETLLRVAAVLGCTVTALLWGVEAESDAHRKGFEDGWRACAVEVESHLTLKPKASAA